MHVRGEESAAGKIMGIVGVLGRECGFAGLPVGYWSDAVNPLRNDCSDASSDISWGTVPFELAVIAAAPRSLVYAG